MAISEKILVKKESLERIQVKLKGLKLSVEDKNNKSVICDILEILDNELKVKDPSIEQIIKDKMNETKFSDPDLNFKLYMLYRKLIDNKISEEEAFKFYNMSLYE